MSRAAGRHTRPKKLNAKQNVPIFREDQVEPLVDYDLQRAAIETGVEKAEEAVCARPAPAAYFPHFLPTRSLLLHPILVALSFSTLLSHHHTLAQNTLRAPYRNTAHPLCSPRANTNPLFTFRNIISNKP